MVDVQTPQIRAGLLCASGSEDEMADSILCFGLFHKSFVIDINPKRIVRYIGIPEKRQDLKSPFEKNFPDENHLHLTHTKNR